MDFNPDEDKFPVEQKDDGDSYRRRALALIWVLAAGFIVVGGLDIAAYWLKCRRTEVEISVGHCLYLSIPLVIGLVILVMSSALARRIEEYLDE